MASPPALPVEEGDTQWDPHGPLLPPPLKPDITKCEYSIGPYDKDLDEGINEANAKADKEVPVRTGPVTDTSMPDREKDGTYIVRVVGDHDPPLPPMTHKEKAMKEGFASEKAWERWRILKATLMQPTSRVFIQRLNGATEADLKNYTHQFDLIKGVAWELLTLLAEFKQGDVWLCTIVGDILYHLPERRFNLFLDPLVREKMVEMDAEVRFRALKKAIDADKANRSVHERHARLIMLEKQVQEWLKDAEIFMKAFKQQQQAVQIMLKLGEKEKYNHDLILYLRDNVGRHEQEIRRMMKVMEEKGLFK